MHSKFFSTTNNSFNLGLMKEKHNITYETRVNKKTGDKNGHLRQTYENNLDRQRVKIDIHVLYLFI